MPCPPSWEELAVQRIDHGVAVASKRLQADFPHLAPTLALTRDLRPQAAATGVDPVELDRTVLEAEAVISSGPVAPPVLSHPDGFPSDEQIAQYERDLGRFEELAARTELCLCVLRTFLARCRRFGLTAGFDEVATATLQLELTLHLAHRREERDLAIQQAEAERAGYERQGPEWAAAARQIAARIGRLQALDDETLLTDRQSTQG